MDLQYFEEYCDREKVVLNGHFVLHLWDHSPNYVAKNRLMTDTKIVSEMAAEIAEVFYANDVEVVLVPEVGAISVGHVVAQILQDKPANKHRIVRSLTAQKCEKPSEKFFRVGRGCDIYIASGTKVGVLDDVVTTGDSLRWVADAGRVLGGKVVASAALWCRGQVDAEELGLPSFFPVIRKLLPTYPRGGPCPLCEADRPINEDYGRGKEYLALRSK